MAVYRSGPCLQSNLPHCSCCLQVTPSAQPARKVVPQPDKHNCVICRQTLDTPPRVHVLESAIRAMLASRNPGPLPGARDRFNRLQKDLALRPSSRDNNGANGMTRGQTEVWYDETDPRNR
jgi:hypothetical protein